MTFCQLVSVFTGTMWRAEEKATAGDFHKESYETAGTAVLRAAVLDYTLQSYVKHTVTTLALNPSNCSAACEAI